MRHLQAIACLLAFFVFRQSSLVTAAKGRGTTRPREQDTEPMEDRPRVARKTAQQAAPAEPPPAGRTDDPNNAPGRPARRIQHKTSRSGYVGLQQVPPYVPNADETGFYIWSENYFFNPTHHDAQLLASRTFESMQAAFNAYGQRQVALARMHVELQRHQEAWESGTRSRYYNTDPHPHRNITTWDEAARELEDNMMRQYNDALRMFLIWYRDYLLDHLAIWFREYRVPLVLPPTDNTDQDGTEENNNDNDDDQSHHWSNPR